MQESLVVRKYFKELIVSLVIFIKIIEADKIVSLIDLAVEKRKLKEFLQTFPCSINPDLEDFLNNKAVTFEKHLRSRTYIYIDNQTKKVAAYFTIAISTLHTEGISSEVIKMLDGYQDDTTSIPCFSRYGFISHSSVSIDFDFTILLTLWFFRISNTVSLNSLASAAQ